MNDEQREQLRALRKIHQERLNKLEQQAAAFGLYAPPHVLTEIDAERAAIAQIDQDLAQAVPAAGALHLQAPPIAPTALIGREQELAALVALLRQPDVRLVTLAGLGGIGKTRLALEVASQLGGDFADGVAWVALSSIREPKLVPTMIAQALGVREAAGPPLVDQIADLLRERRLLLVIDNFEQVVDAAPLVSQLLAGAPGLKVLATSRAVLRLAGEHEFMVQPLGLPDQQRPAVLAELSGIPAVRLFAERARAARPDFALTDANARAVAAICARLDGLPLAIELAAARVRLLAPQALLDRLDSRLKLLTGGARDLPARQQTLRGAIDWSYELLGAGAQALFARLAVFAGGAAFDAIEAICSPADDALPGDVLDSLSTLVENSLLRQIDTADGDSRFTMFETLHEYALDQLASSGAIDSLRERHAAYYLALAEQAQSQTIGADQERWLDRLEQEHDNLRAALSWAIERKMTEIGLRLGAALERFWWVRGHLSDGRRWLAAVLALPKASEPEPPTTTIARAWSLRGAGRLAHMQGDYQQASAFYAESLALQRGLGDKQGIAAALSGLGHVALRLADYPAARQHFEEALAIQRELASPRGIAGALGDLASLARLQGDYQQAEQLNAERLPLMRDLGDRRGTAIVLANLGHIAIEQGDYAHAKDCYEQSLPIFRELEDRGNIAILLGNLGVVARGQGDSALAEQRCHESLALFRALGDRRGTAIALGYLGDTLIRRNDAPGARKQYAESLAIYRDLNDRLGIADRLEGMAAVRASEDRHERAARLWGAAEALRAEIGTPLWPARRAEYERAVAETRARLGEAAFASAWAAGKALTVEQAIAEALT